MLYLVEPNVLGVATSTQLLLPIEELFGVVCEVFSRPLCPWMDRLENPLQSLADPVTYLVLTKPSGTRISTNTAGNIVGRSVGERAMERSESNLTPVDIRPTSPALRSRVVKD